MTSHNRQFVQSKAIISIVNVKMRTIKCILLALLAAFVALVAYRFKVLYPALREKHNRDALEAEEREIENENPTKNTKHNETFMPKRGSRSMKVDSFLTKVKSPITRLKIQEDREKIPKYDSDAMLDSWKLFNDQTCIDTCGKAQQTFDEYWAIRNEFDSFKFSLILNEPFTTNGINYVEIAMDKNKEIEEIKKTLQQSEMSRDSRQPFTDLEGLFDLFRKMTSVMDQMKLLQRADCLPCVRTEAFVMIHNDELNELNAFKTVLKYAKKK